MDINEWLTNRKVTLDMLPKQISALIFNSRFPLMIIVVFIHAKLYVDYNFEVYKILEFTISEFIGGMAVPLFYIISGYLFFINGQFKFSSLVLKLKRRVHSILIPYCIWNAIVLVITLLVELILPSFISGNNKPILQYSALDYIYAFWDTNLINHTGSEYPICFQFWFLRDLMVAMIIIPIISITILRLFFKS